jgi:hypothetical protein
VLLTADAAAYSAVVRRRWKTSALVALVCFASAAAIIWFDYRLMVIAFVVAVPAVIPFIELFFFSRWAKDMGGAAEVRLEGKFLSLKQGVGFDVQRLVNVRVQPDLLVFSERYAPGPKSVRGYLVPAAGEKAQALIASLEALGVKVVHEKATMVTLVAFVWGFIANLLLEIVAGVLMLGAVLTALKNLIDGKAPGWEAGAYFGGAVLALTAFLLIQRFAIAPAADPSPAPRTRR